MKQLFFITAFALLCIMQAAAQTVWNGTVNTAWYNSSGTSFTITTAEELAGLAQLVNGGNNFRNKTITLGADILLNDTANWKNWDENTTGLNTWIRIGDGYNSFSGTFDGDGHTVSGMYLVAASDNNQGLFGRNGGTIRNTGVKAYFIKVGGSDVGGIVGSNWVGTISNCYAIGKVVGSGYIGCLVGYNIGKILNCYATGTVSGTGSYWFGGITGNNGQGASVSNCYFTGAVSGNSEVGGITGGNQGIVSNCYAIGAVSGKSYVGGVAGTNENVAPTDWTFDSADGSVLNCYFIGAVSGTGDVGGIVGRVDDYGSVSKCYAASKVSGNTRIGGAIGSRSSSSGNVSNCYWDNVLYTGSSTNGTGLTTAQMMQQGNFTGFDFTNTFSINAGTSYPYLKWQTALGSYDFDVTVDAIADQTYTGSAIKPEPNVKIGSTSLTKNTDYIVSYMNNINAGKATILISGEKNGKTIGQVVTFTITAKSINDPSITVEAIDPQPYTGSAIKPLPVVKDGTITLKKDTDYTMSYKDSINVGTATITITGKGNYTGTRDVNFTIAKSIDDASVTVDDIADQPYTGSAIKPLPVIIDETTTKTLIAGTDYTLSYKDSINVGQATITITGKGSYTSTRDKTFTITAKAIDDASVAVDAITAQAYTGSAIKPEPEIKDGSTLLIKDTDYTLSYKDSINAGTATITITGIGNYSGTRDVTFKIIKAINDASVTVATIAAQTYTGSVVKPSPVVKDGATTLAAGTDYTLSYKDSINAGQATITITGIGNYAGTRDVNFTITAKAIDDASVTVTAIDPQTYTGSAITPLPVVKDGATTLTEGTDYTLSYKDSINAGRATITITGIGNYSGTRDENFTITAKLINAVTVEAIDPQTYTGSAITPLPVVKDGATTLTEGTDYTLLYEYNINVGQATITITGIGNYMGTRDENFTITTKAIDDASVSVAIANQSYTGSALKPEPEIKDGSTLLVKDVDYTLSYQNNINVGTATITITGKGNYTDTRAVNFMITQKTITSVTVNAIANPVYTGSAFKPVPVVSDNGVTLTENVDYTLSYSNNTNAGTAKITITGKGKYSGTKDVTFTITAKAINEASVTVGVLPSQTYTGAAFTPQPEVKDGTTILVKDRDYTLSYSNNVNAGTATVTITGKGNYGSLRTETFTIKRTAAVAPAPASLPEGLEATYGDRFSSVTLPAGFRWPSPSSTVGNASSYPATVRALYNPDPRNYEDYEVELSLTIHQAQPPAQVVFPETTPETGTAAPVYDPDSTLSDIGLPNGTGSGTFSWRYPNTVPTVGKTEYEVVFTPSDASNYDYSNVPGWDPQTRTIIRTVTLVITPRDIEVLVEANQTYTYTGLPISVTATVTISSLRSSQEVTPALEYLYSQNGQVQNEAVNAGQYEVIARSADANYKGESVPVSFTIEKAQPVILVNDTIANYTGNPVQIAYELTGSYTAPGLSQTLKFTYEGINGTVYNLTEKAPVEIGEYTVHISTPGSVNHLPAEAEISLKIVTGTTDLKDLKDFKDFKDFKVYPNPVSKNSRLVLESGQWTMDNAEVWVEVYNTNGNLLQHIPITQKQTELRSESKEGIYLYLLKSKAGVHGTTKIVVK